MFHPSRSIHALLLMACSLNLFAEEPVKALDELRSRTAPPAAPEPRRPPHPWLADVPPALARLVDIGKVEMAVDQPAVEAAGKTALTVFSFSLAYRMRYRMNELSKDGLGKRQVRITVNFSDVNIETSHRILLSTAYRPAKPWESALVQHEFDHVAISTDPRMFEMLRSLNGRKATLVVSPEGQTTLTDEWANGEIEKSVTDFQQSVEKLIQQYYLRLDKVSSNGLKNIEDRAGFFSELYSVEDLERRHFVYLDDVRKGLSRIPNEQLRQHYRLP
jgi:hypothetical protein